MRKGGGDIFMFTLNDPNDHFDRFGNMPQIILGAGKVGTGGIGAILTGLASGNSGKQIACKAGVGCAVNGLFGRIAVAFPPAAGCAIGIGSSLANSLAKTQCDPCPTSGSRNCAALGAITSALVGCLTFLGFPANELGGDNMQYIIRQVLSSFLGTDVTGFCNFAQK